MMLRGFRIGKVFGIEIIIDASWLLVSFLVSWSFAGAFAEILAGSRFDQPVYIGMGIASMLMFFASLIAHELGHSLVARSKGIEVASITLFIFGGVARIKNDPETPGDELKIALAGPAVSVVIGTLLIGVGWLASAVGSRIAAEIFFLVGQVNIVVAVFNMIPGFPLDGGRVLRAVIWAVRKDVVRATKIASLAGRVVAAMMIGLGLLLILWPGEVLRGTWLILIGLFLSSAATSGYRQLLFRQWILGMAVRDVMTEDVISIPGNIRLSESIDDYFVRHRHTSFPVVGYGEHVEGIVTLKQIRETPRERWFELTVRQVMTPRSPDMETVAEEPVSALMNRVENNPVGRFLVMAGDRLIGFLTTSDLARHFRIAPLLGEGGSGGVAAPRSTNR
jgi:Zn-dependent protease/predicted transcriptional regulator